MQLLFLFAQFLDPGAGFELPLPGLQGGSCGADDIVALHRAGQQDHIAQPVEAPLLRCGAVTRSARGQHDKGNVGPRRLAIQRLPDPGQGVAGNGFFRDQDRADVLLDISGERAELSQDDRGNVVLCKQFLRDPGVAAAGREDCDGAAVDGSRHPQPFSNSWSPAIYCGLPLSTWLNFMSGSPMQMPVTSISNSRMVRS